MKKAEDNHADFIQHSALHLVNFILRSAKSYFLYIALQLF